MCLHRNRKLIEGHVFIQHLNILRYPKNIGKLPVRIGSEEKIVTFTFLVNFCTFFKNHERYFL